MAEGNPAIEAQLQAQLGVSPLAARILVNRGYHSYSDALCYLNPSLESCHNPFDLPDCERAIARIARAVRTGETIFVHGDYDVDGVTSCAIWTRALESLGANVIPYVPHRNEGYGLHFGGVDKALSLGASLLLTCDCGISAIEEIEYARRLGLDTIVTDHHPPGEQLPPALAIVDPKREDCAYPFRELSGAGVSFKMAEALMQEFKRSIEHFRYTFLDLVALATVADVVPLVGENRALVTHGLSRLSDGRRAGLNALLEMAKHKIKRHEEVNAKTISHILAPRLNSIGRMDDPALALRLLLTDDPNEALRLAGQIELRNEERKMEQDRIAVEAEALVEKHALAEKKVLIVAGEKWNGGIVGIVAGRLSEKYRRPALVIALDPEKGTAKGSSRSFGSFDLHAALNAHRELFSTCGGHPEAAGFSFPLDRLEIISEALCRYADEHLIEEQHEIKIDQRLEARDGNLRLLDELSVFAPHGEGNDAPTFLSEKVQLIDKRLTRHGEHVRCKLRGSNMPTVSAIAFGQVEKFAPFRAGDYLDIVYSLEIDAYETRSRVVQWQISDVRPSRNPALKLTSTATSQQAEPFLPVSNQTPNPNPELKPKSKDKPKIQPRPVPLTLFDFEE